MIVGGLGEARQPDAHVENILSKLKGEIESKTGRVYKSIKPVEVKRQVVAGTNYFIKATATQSNGSEGIIFLRIWEDIKANLELTDHKLDVPPHTQLKYF